jgi:predicted transcriptional regulator
MSSAERTEVLNGLDRIVPALLKFYLNSTTRVDILAGFFDVRKSPERRPLLSAYRDLGKRRIRMRAITRITNENLEYLGYLTELIGRIEFRHLNDVKGAFAVSDNEYVVSPSAELLSTRNTQAVFSNAQALVKHHQLLFDTLWGMAEPMPRRMKELHQGTPAQVLGDALAVLKLIGKVKVSPSSIYSESGLEKADAQAAIAYLLQEELVTKSSDGFTVLLEVTPKGLEIVKQGWQSLLKNTG